MIVFSQIIAAYILADLLSGLYHFATDKGFNFGNQIEMFQEHHDTNTMNGFDWQTFAGGMPIVAIGGWFHSAFFLALGVFVALTQVTHYYAHVRSGSPLVHRVVRALQGWLIVSPHSHASHHQPPHNRNFCLLSGWNNFWLNPIVRLFPS